jgi:hypothetical protein
MIHSHLFSIQCTYNLGPSPPAITLTYLTSLSTTILHSKLEDRLRELVQLCFIKKGNRRYKYLVLGRNRSFFAKKKPGCNLCSSSRRFVPLFVWDWQRFLKKNEKKLVRYFNFTFRYIDDDLSLNNNRFGDFVYRIYPIELEYRIPQIQIYLLDIDTLTYISKLTVGAVKNETVWQKKWFQFSLCELSIYM